MNTRARSLAAGAGLPAPLGERELRLLRSFLVVVDAGGLTLGASALQVDLSTVSKQLRELEAWLQVRLAQRGRGGFRLTAAGERLQRVVRPLFAELGQVAADLAAMGQPPRPQLRLGVVDALLTAPAVAGPAGLPAALRRCADALPGLQLTLHALAPAEIERQLLAGTLDAGVLAGGTPASGLEQHRLYAEPNALYVGPGHPWHGRRDLRPEEVARAAFVLDPYGGAPGAPPRAADAALAARADSVETVALLVLSGRYCGFLPEHLVRSTPALAALQPVLPAQFSHAQDIVLTCRRGKVAEPVRALLRALAG